MRYRAIVSDMDIFPRERIELSRILDQFGIGQPVTIISWPTNKVTDVKSKLSHYIASSAFGKQNVLVKEYLPLILALLEAKLSNDPKKINELLRKFNIKKPELPTPHHYLFNPTPTVRTKRDPLRQPLSALNQFQSNQNVPLNQVTKRIQSTPIKKLFNPKQKSDQSLQEKKDNATTANFVNASSAASCSSGRSPEKKQIKLSTSGSQPPTATNSTQLFSPERKIRTEQSSPMKIATSNTAASAACASNPISNPLRSPNQAKIKSTSTFATTWQEAFNTLNKISHSATVIRTAIPANKIQQSPNKNKSGLVALLSPLKRSMQADFAELLRLSSSTSPLKANQTAASAKLSPAKDKKSSEENEKLNAQLEALRKEVNHRETSLQAEKQERESLLTRVRAFKQENDKLYDDLRKARKQVMSGDDQYTALLVKFREEVRDGGSKSLAITQTKTENMVLKSKLAALERESRSKEYYYSKTSKTASPIKKNNATIS